MPDCTTALNCCPGDNSFDYEVAGSPLLNVATSVSPGDGGTTTGDGQYESGDEVTVTATPGVPTSIDVGVDIVFLADESSGNSDIRSLLTIMLPDLDAALQAAGIGSGTVINQYGLVGFASASAAGAHGPTDELAHTHYDLGAFAGFIAELPDLATNPSGEEDAYEAINFAIDNLTWRAAEDGVARIIIFITDEPRTIQYYTEGGPTQAEQFAAITAEILAHDAHIVAVTSNTNPKDDLGDPILGFNLTKTWKADGAGGFTNGTGGNMTPGQPQVTDYGDLAVSTDLDGELWDYTAVRVGIGICSTNGVDVEKVTPGGIVFVSWEDAGAAPGVIITIAGVEYEIDSVTDDDSLVLTTSAGVQTADWSVPRLERDSWLSAFVDSLEEAAAREVAWEFVGWYDAGGQLVSENASYTFTIQNHTTLEARFTHAAL